LVEKELAKANPLILTVPIGPIGPRPYRPHHQTLDGNFLF